MSHHGSQPDPDARRIFDEILANEPGPTARFPRGTIRRDDDGEIVIRIAADPAKQTVVLDFGIPVKWVGFGYDEAIGLSDLIREKAMLLRGIKAK
jgi:hypothetical protein